MLSVLEDHKDDPVVQEIRAAIFGMSEDEQVDLVALAWLGRGDGTIEDWAELRAEADRAHNKRTAILFPRHAHARRLSGRGARAVRSLV